MAEVEPQLLDTTAPVRIGIVVGEVSGDILGSGLLAQLKQRYPNAVFEGIGGSRMLAQGFNSLFDMEELSVMGLVEVLSRIRRLFHVRGELVRHFTENPPDIFIGIDAPDFNLGLESRLKQQGIKTVHYVSPTIWAWREKRVFKIAKAADLVLCLFPFEPNVYSRYQVNAQFVGHTLADQIPIETDKQQARAALNLKANAPTLALLPGSRGGEVAKLLAPFMGCAAKLREAIPDLQVVIPVVNDKRKQQIATGIAQMDDDVAEIVSPVLVDGNARDVMIAADVVLLASGTATLEAMLCKRPMVVGYKLATITRWLMGFLYKQQYFALPNILAGKQLVPELLQDDVNPNTLFEHLLPMLQQTPTHLIDDFVSIHHTLKKDADKQAANAVMTLLNQ